MYAPYTIGSITIDGETTYMIYCGGVQGRQITFVPLAYDEAIILCERLNAAVPEPWGYG